MKVIKYLGLSLFILGFFIFNASFFLSNYILNKATLQENISDENLSERVLGEITFMLDKSYASNFEFISDLDQTFEKVNEKVLADYGISEEEIKKIVALSDSGEEIKLSISEAEQAFPNDAFFDFKKKSLSDYGGWLDGLTYSTKEELQSQLEDVVSKIKSYGIINQKGIDRYKEKDLKYSLTRSATESPVKDYPVLFLFLTYGLCIIGALMYILPKGREGNPGIKNNGIFFSSMKNRGWLGILTGTYLIAFYILLYYFHQYMTNWIIMVDPISLSLSGNPAGQFFLYGFIYTLCILVMGVRMILKYRHSPYQIARTISVMFFQTAFAFIIPEILIRLNQPYFDFKNIWPLDYDFFFDNELNNLVSNGGIGIFMLVWGIALIVIAVPVFVYFFGKRWYCSWVCGCGGLAETLGDPYRQLSDKSLKAWKFERWSIHGVLVFAVLMTVGVLYTYFTNSGQLLGINTYTIRETYGVWIGAAFAGVVGTGFYPLMGNRVWCRFGCPLAAYLGLVQRFKSKFRITTNGGQCISCGNCSTYCEMGIDVRWYAQRGQNIVRSSCVGCGVCSAVCPRGVLNLENLEDKDRTKMPEIITGRISPKA
ncbi:4Fe-4S binding protein [Flexithrix dorotheae]|uniref:4Fe-4S binding protein n=1 Tax=Flexithrix dorotheae TaxID=70993 RepID=UPI00037B52A9|nr:4Fe-4S dicluster domain-containing protein [Flexithrix dorotheae]